MAADRFAVVLTVVAMSAPYRPLPPVVRALVEGFAWPGCPLIPLLRQRLRSPAGHAKDLRQHTCRRPTSGNPTVQPSLATSVVHVPVTRAERTESTGPTGVKMSVARGVPQPPPGAAVSGPMTVEDIPRWSLEMLGGTDIMASVFFGALAGMRKAATKLPVPGVGLGGHYLDAGNSWVVQPPWRAAPSPSNQRVRASSQ